MCLMVTLTARSPPSVLSTWTQSSKGSNLTITVFPLKPGTNIFRPCNLSFASPDILVRVIELLYWSLPLSLLIKTQFPSKIVYFVQIAGYTEYYIIDIIQYNICRKERKCWLLLGFESGGWIWMACWTWCCLPKAPARLKKNPNACQEVTSLLLSLFPNRQIMCFCTNR